MLNATELMRDYIEAHKEEISDAIFAQIDKEFDVNDVARQVLSNFDINEMLAELITLRF